MFNNAERVQIVIKALAVLLHLGVEGIFACVTEGRMANVVTKRQGLDQIGVQLERSCNGPRDLRDLDGVSEPVAKMIRVAAGKNLRLVFQAAKGAGMNNAVAVPLK